MNSSVVDVVTKPAVIDLWSPVIIALIPVLVMLLKRLVPPEFKNEIKIIYPIAALVLGPVVDYLFTWFTNHQTGPHAVLFGLVAIGLREAVDQGRKLVATPAAKLVMVCILAGAVSGCSLSPTADVLKALEGEGGHCIAAGVQTPVPYAGTAGFDAARLNRPGKVTLSKDGTCSIEIYREGEADLPSVAVPVDTPTILKVK